MCYGSGCKWEILTGPIIGGCKAPHDKPCPMEQKQLTCDQCGALVEDAEFTDTGGYCYTCIPEDC